VDFPQIGGVDVDKSLKTSLTIMELVDVLLQRISSGVNSDRMSKGYLEFFHKLLIQPIEEELKGCDTIVFVPVQVLEALSYDLFVSSIRGLLPFYSKWHPKKYRVEFIFYR